MAARRRGLVGGSAAVYQTRFAGRAENLPDRTCRTVLPCISSSTALGSEVGPLSQPRVTSRSRFAGALGAWLRLSASWQVPRLAMVPAACSVCADSDTRDSLSRFPHSSAATRVVPVPATCWYVQPEGGL